MFVTGFEKTAYLEKRPYKSVAIENLDPHKEDEAWTAKIDGAHTIINMKKGKLPRLFSHRISKRTNEPIEYTQKLQHIKRKSPETAVLRGETFATDSAGKAVHPDTVTAMLNRGFDRSLELQKEKGIKTRVALIDVDKIGNKDVRGASFGFKRKFMEGLVKKNPDFMVPEAAYTAPEKIKLLDEIKSGKHPETKEGLITHSISQPEMPFGKAKITSDYDVYIRRIYKEEGKAGRKPMAGGFEYAWEPGGDPVGRVGSGFDHAMKADMLKNPEDYIGRAARVKAHDLSRNKVLMKPSFLGWHVEKNIDKPTMAKQTVIVHKSLSGNRDKAREIARGFSDRMYTARETGQSFRFRQLPPGKFVPGTFKTFSPKAGISIVYGELKKGNK